MEAPAAAPIELRELRAMAATWDKPGTEVPFAGPAMRIGSRNVKGDSLSGHEAVEFCDFL